MLLEKWLLSQNVPCAWFVNLFANRQKKSNLHDLHALAGVWLLEFVLDRYLQMQSTCVWICKECLPKIRLGKRRGCLAFYQLLFASVSDMRPIRFSRALFR